MHIICRYLDVDSNNYNGQYFWYDNFENDKLKATGFVQCIVTDENDKFKNRHNRKTWPNVDYRTRT